MIQVRILKRRRREVKVDPKLGGQWKEKEKVLLLGGIEGEGEVFFIWRPMEGSIAWWPMECEGKTLFIFFHLPPNKLT